MASKKLFLARSFRPSFSMKTCSPLISLLPATRFAAMRSAPDAGGSAAPSSAGIATPSRCRIRLLVAASSLRAWAISSSRSCTAASASA